MSCYHLKSKMLGVEMLWAMSGIGFPLPDYIVCFATIMTGITVMCGYCIWKGVYWGINNDRKRYAAVMAISFILNLIPVAGSVASGGLSGGDPVQSLPLLNLIVLIVFIIIGAEMLVKNIIDRNMPEED